MEHAEAARRAKTDRGVAAFWHAIDITPTIAGHTDRYAKAAYLLDAATFTDTTTTDFWLVVSGAHRALYGVETVFGTTKERILAKVADQVEVHRNTVEVDPFAGLLS